jgi:hypothetical protein
LALYKTYEEGIEVMGQTIGATLDGMRVIGWLAEDILSSVGLGDVVLDENHWYPQQEWLDAFKLIAGRTGDATLRQIGKTIIENAALPPMSSIEEALEGIDIAYHMNHRNAKGQVLFDPSRPNPMLEGIGHYAYQKVPDENKAIMTCDNPYPCAFDMGIVIAFVQRFDKRAKIHHDDDECRMKGDNACKYIVTW